MNELLILAVEDNPTMQKLITLLAKKFGMSVDVVGTAADAVQSASYPEKYRVILMDWSLPDNTGLDCARSIREMERISGYARTPIVAMTGNAMPGDREQCLNAGMDDYISKPFTADEFKTAVLRWAGPGNDTIFMPPPGQDLEQRRLP